MSHPRIILGTSLVGDRNLDESVRFDTSEEVNDFLGAFYSHGGRSIDTARGYPLAEPAQGTSESRLGAVNASARFTIDTKNQHFFGARGPFNTKQKLLASMDASIADLQLSEGVKIDVFFLHLPDRETPLEETAEAMDDAWKQGKFLRWGISNFKAEEVEKLVVLCKEKGWMAPSVYQGHYNVVTRSAEKELLPMLQKYEISFHAYGPTAGGMFGGNHKTARPQGRFDTSTFLGKFYTGTVGKPNVLALVERASAAIEEQGIDPHGAALRWVLYHSALRKEAGDAVLIGASSTEQLVKNMRFVREGPLPEEIVSVLNGLDEEIGKDAPSYHV